jgi:hypothetical protein
VIYVDDDWVTGMLKKERVNNVGRPITGSMISIKFVDNVLTVLGQCFDLAVAERPALLEINPAKEIRLPKHDPGTCTSWTTPPPTPRCAARCTATPRPAGLPGRHWRPLRRGRRPVGAAPAPGRRAALRRHPGGTGMSAEIAAVVTGAPVTTADRA